MLTDDQVTTVFQEVSNALDQLTTACNDMANNSNSPENVLLSVRHVCLNLQDLQKRLWWHSHSPAIIGDGPLPHDAAAVMARKMWQSMSQKERDALKTILGARYGTQEIADFITATLGAESRGEPIPF